eukprot:406743-Pyramimonas_sp.AAC.1
MGNAVADEFAGKATTYPGEIASSKGLNCWLASKCHPPQNPPKTKQLKQLIKNGDGHGTWAPVPCPRILRHELGMYGLRVQSSCWERPLAWPGGGVQVSRWPAPHKDGGLGSFTCD